MAGISGELRKRLIASFMLEQQGLVEKIAHGLQLLDKQQVGEGDAHLGSVVERQRDLSLLNELFRQAHSLKGSAQAVGMTGIANLGRALEELLFDVKEGHLPLTPSLLDKLHETLEAVESAMLELALVS